MNEDTFYPEAVIFDMDGLMLDTERPAVEMWVEAAKKMGCNIEAELVLRTVGVDEKTTRAAFINEYGPEFPYDDTRRELVRIIIEKAETEGIPHRPGLLTLLDHLGALGIPLGVATSTDLLTARWKLEKAGIGDRFAVLTCGDEISRGKPAPDIFLLAAKRLGKAPGACVGFEDSPAGLKGLHAAGIRSVFIKDILEPAPEILAAVWRRCADLAEASKLFGQRGTPRGTGRKL
jgi:HAD superfamily hydrolase (TIGR01509 family)